MIFKVLLDIKNNSNKINFLLKIVHHNFLCFICTSATFEMF